MLPFFLYFFVIKFNCYNYLYLGHNVFILIEIVITMKEGT